MANDTIFSMVTQAIILAAGECSRFFPFTRRQHKSDFILLDKPIIARTIDSLRRLGITKIEVVESPDDDQSLENTFNQYASDLSVRFWTQQQPLGTGNAILQALSVLEDRFLVINPQQLNLTEHFTTLNNFPEFLEDPNNLILFSRPTDKPERYGMFYLDGQRVTGVIEKPSHLDGLSNQRNMGVYLLTRDFAKFMNTQPVTDFQLIESLNLFVKDHPAFAVPTTASGLTLKYATDLFPIQKYLLDSENKNNVYIHPTAKISANCTLIGPLSIEANTVIGDNCHLENSIIGQNNIIGSNSFISSSIVGNHISLPSNFKTNIAPAKIIVKDKEVDTGLPQIGALIGDHNQITFTSTVPGQIIPESS
jgi:NDP-sugar pyrophosphorylase family protein